MVIVVYELLRAKVGNIITHLIISLFLNRSNAIIFLTIILIYICYRTIRERAYIFLFEK